MFTITLPWRFAPIKFPITEWLPEYQWKEWLVNDLAAGFTVFVFLIPQGMAYALLAGMPPIYGLYSSIVPVTSTLSPKTKVAGGSIVDAEA